MKVLVRIRIQDIEIEIIGLVDTGCTSCLINKKIIPQHILKTFKKSITTIQMDGSYNIYDYYIEKAQISFLNTCNEFYNPTYNAHKILARYLNIKTYFVIGLHYLLQNRGGCLITRDGIMLFRNNTYTPVQTTNYPTIERKFKTHNKNLILGFQSCCENCRLSDQYSSKNLYEEKEQLQKDNNIEKFEYLEDIEKDYTLINIETQFYNFQKGINRIEMINSPKDLDNIVVILDEMKIIEEKLLVHWGANKIMYKLDIINPEYTIKKQQL